MALNVVLIDLQASSSGLSCLHLKVLLKHGSNPQPERKASLGFLSMHPKTQPSTYMLLDFIKRPLINSETISF